MSGGGGVGESCSMNLMEDDLVGGQERFRSLSSAKMAKGRRERSVSPPPALDVAVAKVHACNVCCRVCM